MSNDIIVIGKVATISSEHDLAFNVGNLHGVRKGDVVTLFRTVQVTDPETEELLGEVRYPRIRLEVSLVSERYCVATVTDRVSIKGALAPVRKKLTETGTDWGNIDAGWEQVTIGEHAEFRRPAAAKQDPVYEDPPF